MAKTKTTELVQATTASPLTQVEQEERSFDLLQQKALVLANSTMVPDTYRGETNVGNVIIAMEMAHRMNVPALMVMQNLNIIYGRPSFSTAFLIAGINSTGRYTTLHYEMSSKTGKLEDTKCRCYAFEKDDTERKFPLYGSWVSMQIAKAEGWIDKKGSKWKTMPEQMLRYRAATLWQRTYCPEVSMGMMTDDEARDVYGKSETPTNSREAAIREAMERASCETAPIPYAEEIEEETDAQPEKTPQSEN